jgi:hypothetical protein
MSKGKNSSLRPGVMSMVATIASLDANGAEAVHKSMALACSVKELFTASEADMLSERSCFATIDGDRCTRDV